MPPLPRLLLPLVALTAACYAYDPVRPGGTPPAVVRLRFAAPRDLAVVRPRGDTVALRDMLAVTGRVTATRGDTLDVRVGATEPERPEATGAHLRVVPAPGDRAEAQRFSAGRTAAMAAGTRAGMTLLTRIAQRSM